MMKLLGSISRIWRIVLIAVLVLAGALTAWQVRQRAAEIPLVPEKLTIGVADAFFVIPVLVAEDQGFLKDAGLDVTYRHFPSGKAAMDVMLKEGGIDIATVSEPPLVFAGLRQLDIVALGNFTKASSDAKTIAHPDSGITSVAGLRGKRVGVTAGTISEYCLYVALTDAGMTMADVMKVPLAGGELAEALGKHQVEAVATYEPYGMQARAAVQDKGKIFDSKGRCVVNTGYISPRALPKARQEAVVRLLRGTELSIEWIQKHRNEAIAIIARRLNADPQLVMALWDSYDFSLRLDQAFLNSLDAQAKWAVDSALVPPTALPNFLDYVDYSALAVVNPGAVNIIR